MLKESRLEEDEKRIGKEEESKRKETKGKRLITGSILWMYASS